MSQEDTGMPQQTDIFDMEPSMLPPVMYECMKTCANMGKEVDEFPAGGKRCEYGWNRHAVYGRKCGTQVAHYCRCYKCAEK